MTLLNSEILKFYNLYLNVISVETNGIGLNPRVLQGKISGMGYTGMVDGKIALDSTGTKFNFNTHYGPYKKPHVS